ncbi:MAG: ComF family protein [Gammaproteobacteria bacterium]|nr:ComF family protein [Gammaproteobacteria bacterium]
MLKHSAKKLSQLFLPFTCVVCHAPADRKQDLCHGCFNELPFYGPACLRCGTSLASASEHCGVCLQNPPPFDATHILFHYQPPITQWIIQLKFHQQLLYARLLGELFAEALLQSGKNLPDAILPVPLHAKRLRERGYNQALEIAKPIARAIKRPILLDSCLRSKSTTPQTTLSRRERQQNMQNAFILQRNLHFRTIAVIDDVITTGYTMAALCQTLKQHHCDKVAAWCCARGSLSDA